jgi:hypothetical protein
VHGPPPRSLDHVLERFLVALGRLEPAQWATAAVNYESVSESGPFRQAQFRVSRLVEALGRARDRERVEGLIHTLASRTGASAHRPPRLDLLEECALTAAMTLLVAPEVEHDCLRMLYAPFAEIIPLELAGPD